MLIPGVILLITLWGTEGVFFGWLLIILGGFCIAMLCGIKQTYCQFKVSNVDQNELKKWRIYLPKIGGLSGKIRQFAKLIDEITNAARPAAIPVASPPGPAAVPAAARPVEIPAAAAPARKVAAPLAPPPAPPTVVLPYKGAMLVLPDGSEIRITEKTRAIGRNDFVKHVSAEVLRFVSRQHLLIKYEEGKYYIGDSNSANGTKANGVSLKSGERYEVRDGDLIVLGEVLTLIFRNGDVPFKAPAPLQQEIKPEAEKKEIMPVVIKEEIKPEVKKEEIKPEVKKEEIKPEVKKEEIKPVIIKEEIRPEAEKKEIKPVVIKEEIKPEAKKEEIKPEAKKEEIKPEAKKVEIKPGSEKQVLSRENVGTRMDTFSKASSYWLSFVSSGAVPPFVCYKFTGREESLKGFNSLSFIMPASDTGEFITLVPTLYYGFYEVDPGQWEVLICGETLTLDMYHEAAEKLTRAGGILKDRKEPSAAAATVTPRKPSSASLVSFSRQEKKGESRYHIYRGPSREAALEFLKSLQPITEFLVYHIVETPEGNFGRDKDGIYREKT
jgi:hypothetical protein